MNTRWLPIVLCVVYSAGVCAAQAQMGMGGYGGGMPGGGYGGVMYGGGYGGIDPLTYTLLLREKDATDPSEKQFTANRLRKFSYRVDSLKPQEITSAGYGSEGYGGEGYDPGGAGMSSDMGGGPGMMGPGAGMPGSAGRRGNRSGMRPPTTITILAYIFDNESVDGRTRIELVTPPPPKRPPAGGMGGMGGYDMGGYGGEASYGGEGGGYGAGMGGYGGGYGGEMEPPKYVPLASLAADGTEESASLLSQAELKIVSDTIRQMIWKADAVKQLNNPAANVEATEKLEQLLRSVLTEEYETQLARQEIEVKRIERRVSELRDELARRRAAKQRVIEVQLGNIVLEAQGLLSR